MFKVLVVDDDESVRKLLREALAVSYEVVTASSCDEAQSIIEEGSINLVFLDLWLHGLDSSWLVPWIKEQKIPCKVILVTGDMESYDRIMMRGHLADGLLGKPFDIHDVIEIAATTLQSLGDKLE